MAEFDSEQAFYDLEWHNTMLNLAATDPRLRNVASWLLEIGGGDEDSELRFEKMVISACKNYALDPEIDSDEVMERCEAMLVGEQFYG